MRGWSTGNSAAAVSADFSWAVQSGEAMIATGLRCCTCDANSAGGVALLSKMHGEMWITPSIVATISHPSGRQIITRRWARFSAASWSATFSAICRKSAYESTSPLSEISAGRSATALAHWFIHCGIVSAAQVRGLAALDSSAVILVRRTVLAMSRRFQAFRQPMPIVRAEGFSMAANFCLKGLEP